MFKSIGFFCTAGRKNRFGTKIQNTGAGCRSGNPPPAPRQMLLKRSTQVVDAVVGMARVQNFENHIISSFELAGYRIELRFVTGRVLVDAGDDQD
jgi:hypothetical protein